MSSVDAAAAIEHLGLRPHPEGGWFAETWRHDPGDGSRGSGTAIYFLLEAGQRSHWHTIDAVEIWHHLAGGPLSLHVAESARGPVRTLLLGPDLAAGERHQGIVPADAWQAAEPLGSAVLVSCTVSPAFSFEGFALARPGWEPGAGDPFAT
jgi:hypothetical protein